MAGEEGDAIRSLLFRVPLGPCSRQDMPSATIVRHQGMLSTGAIRYRHEVKSSSFSACGPNHQGLVPGSFLIINEDRRPSLEAHLNLPLPRTPNSRPNRRPSPIIPTHAIHRNSIRLADLHHLLLRLHVLMVLTKSTKSIHILRLLLALKLHARGIETMYLLSAQLLEIGPRSCSMCLRASALLKNMDYVATGVLVEVYEAHAWK